MSFPDPALVMGLAAVAVTGLLVGLVVARRPPPEVRLTITRNALPPRDPSTPLDRTDPVGVRVGEPDRPASTPVALRIASGADPVLYRLLALDSPDEIAALELESPPEHQDRVAALRAPRPVRVEWQESGVVGRAGTPVFARAEGGAGTAGAAAAAVADDAGDATDTGTATNTVEAHRVNPVEEAAPLATTATPGVGPAAPEPGDGPASPAQAAAGTDGQASVDGGGGEPFPGGAAGDTPDGAAGVDVACAEERRLVQELAALVMRAHAVHADALDHQQGQRRDYDAATARAEAAAHVMDRRRVLEEKEAAQRRFRAERISSRSAAAAEEAAARWLATINQLNVRVRDAQRVAAAERRRATRLVAEIEASGDRVDAARIALESAEHKAQQAREALAACEELHGARLTAAAMASSASRAGELTEDRPADNSGGSTDAPQGQGHAPEPATPVGGDQLEHIVARPRSVLVRILDGDEDALDDVVAALAPDSVEDARHWHLELAALLDALVAAAIDAAHVDVPRDHPFWSAFSAGEAREIAVALASLGYRFDGRGGFADDRVPSIRDLTLAVGYTGLDPRRIRRWPGPSEIPLLLEGAHVAVGEFVLAGAPDLTLGQMVGLLGRRAPGLATLWDEWGRVRPLLASAGR